MSPYVRIKRKKRSYTLSRRTVGPWLLAAILAVSLLVPVMVYSLGGVLRRLFWRAGQDPRKIQIECHREAALVNRFVPGSFAEHYTKCVALRSAGLEAGAPPRPTTPPAAVTEQPSTKKQQGPIGLVIKFVKDVVEGLF